MSVPICFFSPFGKYSLLFDFEEYQAVSSLLMSLLYMVTLWSLFVISINRISLTDVFV